MSDHEITEDEKIAFIQSVYEARWEAFKQLIWGFLWWLGSAIAMYVALGSTSDGVLWFGGALGALFHWYRAFRIIKATFEAGLKRLIGREIAAIAISAILVTVSSLVIFPEWSRTSNPQIGTCWGDVSNSEVVPVACWSSTVIGQTVAFSSSPESCPMEADTYLEATAKDDRIVCLKSR
jgi:di/tricarboxylate transporter